MRIKSLIITFLSLNLACSASNKTSTGSDQVLQSQAIIEGFLYPESAAIDPVQEDIYISNFGGPVSSEEDNGFISRLDKHGEILELKYFDGSNLDYRLRIPKGMVIKSGKLLVCDYDAIQIFDIAERLFIKSIDLSSLDTLANDLVFSDDQTLWITDPGKKLLHKLTLDSDYNVLAQQSFATASPNGITKTSDGRILFGSWDGQGIFQWTGQKQQALDHPQSYAQIDGITSDQEGNIYITEWIGATGRLLQVDSAGNITRQWQDYSTPADLTISESKKMLIVPDINRHHVVLVPLQDSP
jgi:sugar lactone lactonase YvrE